MHEAEVHEVEVLLRNVAERIGYRVEFTVHHACSFYMVTDGAIVRWLMVMGSDEASTVHMTQMEGRRTGRKVKVGTFQQIEDFIASDAALEIKEDLVVPVLH